MVSLIANATPEEIKFIAAMSDAERANLSATIKSTDPHFILDLVEGKTDEFICPFCGSGSGRNHHNSKATGLKPTNENGIWLYHCFANNDCIKGTLIDVIAKANNLSTRGKDFFEVLVIAAKVCNINFFVPTSKNKEVIKTNNAEKIEKVTAAVAAKKFERLTEAQSNLENFVKNQGGTWRGLSLETLQRMHAGFLPNVYFPAAEKELPAVVIPNDLGGVYFRSITDKFHKNNSPTATTTVYLPEADTFNLIVTEGAINAASILQAFYSSYAQKVEPNFGIIASGGTSGNKHVVDKCKELIQHGKTIKVIIAYDNDTNGAGQTAADKLLALLAKSNIPACKIDITNKADVDCNDLLQQDGGNFILFDCVNNALAQVTFSEQTAADDDDTKSGTVEIDSDSDSVTVAPFQSELDKVIADKLNDPEVDKFFVPLPFVVTNHGIKKIGKKDISKICPRPVLIKDQFFNLDDRTYKFTLEYLDARKIWQSITPQPRGVIFNRNKIVDCINFGLPISTGNAAAVVDWFYNLFLSNEKFIPTTYTVNRCGWYNYKGKDFFIDPRIKNTVEENGKNINIVVDSENKMTNDLTKKGTLEKWLEAYSLAKDSTIARVNVATAVAPALLKVLGERNFVVYVYGKTRGGKSTILNLAASAVGNFNLVKTFNGTNTAFNSLAVNTNHYPFFVDEKQAADGKLKSDFQRWIYTDAEGIERARAQRDGTVKPAQTWQHITICNGETPLLNDNATGGAFTRILQIHAPNIIMDSDDCQKVREITLNNYGHVYPLIVEYLKTQDADNLREKYLEYQDFCIALCKRDNIKVIPDYCRYVAFIYLSDEISRQVLNLDWVPLDCREILNLLPTTDDTDDAKRAEVQVSAFIASKASHFIGSEFYDVHKGLDIYGVIRDDYLYIISTILNKHLDDNGFDYKKVVADLIAGGYFISADKVNANEGNKPRDTVLVKINNKPQRCYKVKFDEDNKQSEEGEK